MVASVPPKSPPSAADVMAQLAAARGEVAAAAAKSRALRQQSQAEGLVQAGQAAQHREAAALSDDAEALCRRMDVKA